MMPHSDPDDTDTMATLLPFPGAAATATDVEPAPPVVEGEYVDEDEADDRNSHTPTNTLVPAQPTQIPLTPQHAGHLRYLGSVLHHGTRQTPAVLWNKAWDVIKHADLREGHTHRGPIADRHATEHGRRVAARRAAVTTVLQAAAAPWTRWQVRIHKKVPMPVVTWTATAGSLAAAAYPNSPFLAPFQLLNTTLGDLIGAAGSVAWHVTETVAGATWPVATPAALAVGLGYGVMAEHRRRQALCAQLGVDHPVMGDPQQAEVSDRADLLTTAFVEAGIISAGQRVELRGIPYQVAGGVCAPLLLPRGAYTGQIRKTDRLKKLASVLDTTPQHLSVVDGNTERECDLTVYKVLPFTGPPVPHPLLAGGRVDVLTQGIPAGLDINGVLVRVDIKGGRHGLIVSSSGNGKSQHIMSLMISLAGDPSSTFVLLDGKPDGALDPIRPLLEQYTDAAQKNYLEAAADLLEHELDEMRDRQRRIRAGEHVGWRSVILDEFQMFTGNPGAGDLKKDSPCQRIRAALMEISRLGRSVNVGLVLATQSYDGNTIDDAVLNNVGWRLIGFAPSGMSREALGEHAERYSLDTSKMLVDTVQTGTAVMIAPNIERYALARGWYQHKKVVAAAVERLLELRRQAGNTPARHATPKLSTVRQRSALPSVLDLLADVIRDDETGPIPTQDLAKRLGYDDPAGAGAKRLGEELARAKLPPPAQPKRRWPGHKNPVSVTDLDTIRDAITTHFESETY